MIRNVISPVNRGPDDRSSRLDDRSGLARRYRRAGAALTQKGDFDLARDYYLASLAIDPLDAKAQDGLGGVEFWRGDLPQAIEHFRRAVALAPDAAATRTNLGCALHCMGQEAGAIEQLQTAILLSPECPEAHL